MTLSIASALPQKDKTKATKVKSTRYRKPQVIFRTC